MALDRTKLEMVLERAEELDSAATRSTFSDEEVARLGDELGISPAAVTRALAEASASQSLTVGATALIHGEQPRVLDHVTTYLQMRGLEPIGAGVWEQRTGWWPDLYRFRALTPIAVSAVQSGEATRVTITAGLDRIWRLHLVAGALGLLAATFLAIPPLALTSLFAAGLQAGLVAGSSWWSYVQRSRAIRTRLQRGLEEIASPTYQLQPW